MHPTVLFPTNDWLKYGPIFVLDFHCSAVTKGTDGDYYIYLYIHV